MRYDSLLEGGCVFDHSPRQSESPLQSKTQRHNPRPGYDRVGQMPQRYDDPGSEHIRLIVYNRPSLEEPTYIDHQIRFHKDLIEGLIPEFDVLRQCEIYFQLDNSLTQHTNGAFP